MSEREGECVKKGVCGCGFERTQMYAHTFTRTHTGVLRENFLFLRRQVRTHIQVCYEIYFDPVALPCGHALCRACLERVLDTATVCPYCRRDVSQYRRRWCYHTNAALMAVLQRCFPAQLAARQEQLHLIDNDPVGLAPHHQLPPDPPSLAQPPARAQQPPPTQGGAGTEGSEWMGVFVCMVAWPMLPCQLHVFEARYRLLMRRVNQTATREFVMCAPAPAARAGVAAVASYGTVLAVQDMTVLPDGRLLVTCRGVCAVRVEAHTMHDEYVIARVRRLADVGAAPPLGGGGGVWAGLKQVFAGGLAGRLWQLCGAGAGAGSPRGRLAGSGGEGLGLAASSLDDLIARARQELRGVRRMQGGRLWRVLVRQLGPPPALCFAGRSAADRPVPEAADVVYLSWWLAGMLAEVCACVFACVRALVCRM